ncbi:MAG: hypothetical protein OEY52_00430 [Gammaproteobacteria bacterium]|nr:hypothetical protein [Gammaproteobacteria bacterium]
MRVFDVQLPLKEFAKEKSSQHIEDIFQQLQISGFSYNSLTVNPTEDDTPDDELIEEYRELIEQLMDEDGYANIEVIQLKNYSKTTGAYVYKPVRDKFETRFITHGKCSLFIQVKGQIFEFQCSQGDMIKIPGELCYWFEVGVHACRYIHLYTSGQAWDKPSERQDIQPCSVYRQSA